ncbi:MAG: glycosyltransferase family 2 protein [Acidiferrobacterales bacterium]
MALKTAVLLPCYNEGPAIAEVVRAFRQALPDCDIYVYDNGSTDDTAVRAHEAGAIVRFEPRRGKGNVVARMFTDIKADVYVMSDGDNTYDPSTAPAMIEQLMQECLDMVVGVRSDRDREKTYRPGHRLGNRIMTAVVAYLFEDKFHDVLSGYRVLSRRFVKSFPSLGSGFEIEVLLTVHALELRLPTAEVESSYFERVPGTTSKLNTVADGLRILGTIFYLFKEVHPFRFFGILAAALAGISFAFGIPVILEFLRTGMVPRFPTAILATGLMILAAISLTCGIILDSVSRGRLEVKRLHYQSLAPAGESVECTPLTGGKT